MGRFAFTKIDNRVQLQLERFVDRIGAAGRDDAEGTRTRRFRIGWDRRFAFLRGNFQRWTFSFVDQTPRRFEQLFSRRDFIYQTEL